jgi:DeoR/GlpR family transcriptional regulator of sugar metabolism
MWQGDRKQRIGTLLETFGSVSVERLAQEFDVSNRSIRRDLVAMERDGRLRRVHGGAVSLPAEQDASYGARSAVRLQEKRAIALAALALIKSGQTLFLDGNHDGGTGGGAEGVPELNILTNSLQVATSMASTQQRMGNRVFLLGGAIVHEPPRPAVHRRSTISIASRPMWRCCRPSASTWTARRPISSSTPPRSPGPWSPIRPASS